ncbi:MAG: dihydrodipicolinate synthase family protein [Anaerolineae bacterium]
MKPFTASEILGNWATLLLPINVDDSIDFVRLDDELEVLAQAGVNGIYSNGTAGEFHAQTEQEFDRIHELVAQRCEAAKLPFQIGASHMSFQISIERIKRTRALCPSAFQVILADWFPLQEAEMVTCLEHFARAADPIGLVLYNPPHAKRRLTPAQIGSLKRAVPALVGVKVAGGDASWYAEMRAHCSELSIFIPGHHLATGFSHGAAGAYSNVACLHPVGAQRWYDLMPVNLTGALEIEHRIRQYFDEYITPYISERHYSNGAVDKLLSVIGRWAHIGSRLRLPYRWIDETEAERLRQIGLQVIPEILAIEGGVAA